MGIPWGRNQGLYKLLGARIHNLIGGSQDELPELLHKNKLQEDLTQIFHLNTRGGTNSFGGDVDLGPLNQSTKNQEIWVDG